MTSLDTKQTYDSEKPWLKHPIPSESREPHLFLQQVEALGHLVGHFRVASRRGLGAARLGEEDGPQGRQTAEEHFAEPHAVVGLGS